MAQVSALGSKGTFMSSAQQAKASIMSRQLSARGIFIAYLVIVLFAAAPILSVVIASGIAHAYGARLDEAGSHPCVVHGVDIGGLLYDMFVAGWFMLLTIPLGLLSILALTIMVLKERKQNAA